ERPRTPQAVAVEGGDENEETEANVDEDVDAGKQKYLDEIRFLVEGGMCEEELDSKVPTATQLDPESGHEIVTNNLGSMIITAPDGSVRTVIFPDHTRISTERSELGEKISVSKLGTPLCYISQNGSNALFTVELEDGSTVCVDQSAEGDEVAVKRCGAPSIKVNVNTGKTVVDGTAYVAEYMRDDDGHGFFTLRCFDDERNSFEVDGRTNCCSVKLATCLEESKDMPSPRPGAPTDEALRPMAAVYHPDKDFLPSVDGLSSHPPRLIVVYGDGLNEAQEILPSKEASEALNASDAIKESVAMDSPMDGCTSHYLIKTGCSVDLETLPIPEISVPSCVSRQVEAVEDPNPVPPAPSRKTGECKFTTVRHLIEYPEVSDSMLREFEDACVRYSDWTEAHKGLHDEVAARMQREAEARAAEGKNLNYSITTKVALFFPSGPANHVEAQCLELAARWQHAPGAEEMLNTAVKLAEQVVERLEKESTERKEPEEESSMANDEPTNSSESHQQPSVRGRVEAKGTRRPDEGGECANETTAINPYNYFQSEHGLNFLVEHRMLGEKVEPSQLPPKPLPKLEVVGSREERAAFARRSPWDPLLPHEWAKMEELIEQKQENEEKSIETGTAVVEKADQVKDSGEQLRREAAEEALPSEREEEDANYSHMESAK
ncbi:hypothetical protein FOZ63_025384, partial [Perkinsus olseni]